MRMLPDDEKYFREFAPAARAQKVSLEDYYGLIQRNLRNESGGVTSLRPNEMRGLEFARSFMRPEETCLILGCGCGSEAAWLIANGITKITGLDIAEGLLETCRKSLGIQTVRGDMRRTGLADQSYDMVLTHRSLHHMFYPFQSLEESARLAGKKVMVLNEPVRSRLKTVVRGLKGERIISAANIYEYQFDRDDVHRYMAFNGFRLAGVTRYWETVHGLFTNRLLNFLGRSLGNRFSAVYQRLSLPA